MEVEYLIESSKFKGCDSRSENEYDEVSGDEDDEEKCDETIEAESFPESVL
jgi:hypothetical protein